MKFGVVNKSTSVNRCVLHTLQRNITHLTVITRKTNIKLGILKGELEKSREPYQNGKCTTGIRAIGKCIKAKPKSVVN